MEVRRRKRQGRRKDKERDEKACFRSVESFTKYALGDEAAAWIPDE